MSALGQGEREERKKVRRGQDWERRELGEDTSAARESG